MPGLIDFLRGISGGGPMPGYGNLFDPTNPMSYGMDMPSQGGFLGNMVPPSNSPSYASSSIPMGGLCLLNSPQMGYGDTTPSNANPILNPTMDPYNMDLMNSGGEEQFTGTGNQTPQGGIGASGPHFDPEKFYNDYMAQYKPAHTASDYYNKLMMEYPTRDMNPGFMRRLAASFAGMSGGPEAADKVLDQPFYDALEDWKNKMQPALASANLERYENVNERNIMSQAATRATAQQKADILQEAENRKNREGRDLAETRRARLALQDWKAKHPLGHFGEDDEGNVTITDPISHQVDYVTDDDGDMVKSSKLPEWKRIQEQQAGREKIVGMQQEGANQRAEMQGWQTVEIDDPSFPPDSGHKVLAYVNPRSMPGGQSPSPIQPTVGGRGVTGATKVTGAGGGVSKEQSANQQKIAEYNRAQAAFNNPDHPEWQNWIELGKFGANTYGLKPYAEPGYWGNDKETPESYKAMTDYIKGNKTTTTKGDIELPSAKSNTSQNITQVPNINQTKNTSQFKGGPAKTSQPSGGAQTNPETPTAGEQMQADTTYAIALTGKNRGRAGRIKRADLDPNKYKEISEAEFKALAGIQ
jgi:hypothetical protein